MSSLRRCQSFLWVVTAALVAVAACNRSAPPEKSDIRFVEDLKDPSKSYVEVTGGASAKALSILRRSPSESDEWRKTFTVHVRGASVQGFMTPIAGKYAVDGSKLRFTPLFPFEPGRQYEVQYRGGLDVPEPYRAELVQHEFTPTALPESAPTTVTRVFPSTDVWPENELRFYIHFSAPMGRRGGIEHIKLLDDRGREVEDPFLPLDAEFWNADRTRYTVFFDPGRQKRGILPNREMGPSLVEGRKYTLVVDAAWLDGNSKPLATTFKREFRVGPPDQSALNPATWKVTPPKAESTEPLSVVFPEPLDHGLLMRALGVRRDGQPVTGDVRIYEAERHWVFVPAQSWQAGRYELVALSFLEDLAGNRIGRAFEVDNFERVDKVAEPEATTIPFTLARQDGR
jgi:hypothetical protein